MQVNDLDNVSMDLGTWKTLLKFLALSILAVRRRGRPSKVVKTKDDKAYHGEGGQKCRIWEWNIFDKYGEKNIL